MDWQGVMNQTVSMMAPVVGSIIVTLLGIGLKRANEWIKAKVESERMEAALIQVSESVVSTVLDIEAEVRRYMSDGRLSKAEGEQLKEAARNRVYTQVPKALEALTRAGIEDLDGYLNGKIEQAVNDARESRAAL